MTKKVAKKVAVKKHGTKLTHRQIVELCAGYNQRGEMIKQLTIEKANLAEQLKQSEQSNANALAQLKVSLAEAQKEAFNATQQSEYNGRQITKLKEDNLRLEGTIEGQQLTVESLVLGLRGARG